VFCDFELYDPLGNRLTVEPLTSQTVIIRIRQDDGGVNGTVPPQEAQVIVTLDEVLEMAASLRPAA
jgi:hypothetical protein